jgi:hypothetical protein
MFVKGHFKELEPLIIPVHFPCFIPLSLIINIDNIPEVIPGIPVEFIFDQFGLKASTHPIGHVRLEIVMLLLFIVGNYSQGCRINLKHLPPGN